VNVAERAPVLATIGYQGASLDDLIATLKAAEIATLLDVRAVAWSRRSEFAKRALSASLAAAGIVYEHLPGLGNPEAGREAAKAGRLDDYRKIYAGQLDSAEGKAALERAVERARKGPVVLMCMERDHARCHRAMAAARLAALLGVEARHMRVEAGPETLPLFR
jgi:uncharacterized protein (DUF488 family)